MQKICTKCQQNKALDKFYPDSDGALGRRSQCKSCFQDAAHRRFLNKKIKLNTLNARTCTHCRTSKPLTEFSVYQAMCKVCKKAKAEKWRRTHPNYRTNTKKYEARIKLENTPVYQNIRLRAKLRSRIRAALQTNAKVSSTLRLLGCSIEELRVYLESKFQHGMTWENHGRWHIDHVKPCASFDLSQLPQQQECFHYTNLQPLWAYDNLSKGKNYRSSP